MRVAILGCGYVGCALASHLAANGHDPIGVRRSADGLAAVEDAGVQAVQADITDADALDAVPDVDALVFAASSGGRGADAAWDVYVEGLQTVIDHFGGRSTPPERLVYTSSTGVYGDHGGDWVDETTALSPTTEKTEALATAERVAHERSAALGMDGLVARFAGLYGPDRYRLDRYLDGPVTEGYLNMVHRDDAAGAVAHLLTHPAPPATTLVVDDEPVSKWAFADWLADECGTERPAKRTVESRFVGGDLSMLARRRLQTRKRCANGRLRRLGYVFSFPTFRAGYRPAIAARRGETP
jgi:nucleoside-diphosphate-sugar epimerase